MKLRLIGTATDGGTCEDRLYGITHFALSCVHSLSCQCFWLCKIGFGYTVCVEFVEQTSATVHGNAKELPAARVCHAPFSACYGSAFKD